MTWTYGGDPANSEIDAVRFTVADTDSTDPLLSDEEISYLLGAYSITANAAIAAARAIAAKFSRLADHSRNIGDLSLSESQSQKSFQYHHLGDHLAGLASSFSAPPVAVANSGALGAEFTVGKLDKFTP